MELLFVSAQYAILIFPCPVMKSLEQRCVFRHLYAISISYKIGGWGDRGVARANTRGTCNASAQ